MSKNKEIYEKYFKISDRFISDFGLPPNLLDGLYEEERQEIENDIVYRFKNGNFLVLDFILKLKYYDGVEILHDKFVQEQKNLSTAIKLAGMLYSATRKSIYFEFIKDKINYPRLLQYVLPAIGDCLKKGPTVELLNLSKFLLLSTITPNQKIYLISSLLETSGLVENVVDFNEKYREEIYAIRSNNSNFNIETFFDEKILPSFVR